MDYDMLNIDDYVLTLEKVSYELNIFSALKNVSFSLKKGENIVIFGTESSGIDMLSSIIAGVRSGFFGKILYKGVKLSDLDKLELNIVRKDFSYLQRGYGLIGNMTVWENIALPLRYHTKLENEKIEEKTDYLIRELNLEFCQELRPVNLRMSEKLKTAYARSIALDPDLLIVEYPLEGQCTINTLVFLEKIAERGDMPDKSTIVVTYNPEKFLQTSNRFLMLDSGRIVFDGNREEFLSKNNAYVQQYLDTETVGPLQII